MNYDNELATRVMSELEISDNPQSLLASELIRELTAAVEQLTLLLCCPCSFADGLPDTCDWIWSDERLACSRCGQLATDWRVRAGTVLETLRQPISKPAGVPLLIERDDRFSRKVPPAAQSQTTKTCLGCGKELSLVTKFCPSCGRTAQGDAYCMGCNSPVAAGETFCSQCGTKVA